MIICFIKGATAYELQIGPYVLRVIHLSPGGRYLKWHFWRKWSFRKYY